MATFYRPGDRRKSSEQDPSSQPRPDRFDTVVIDAGHGGENAGARGAGGLLEKDLVLDVSLRLAKRIESRGIDVVLTRRDDRFVSLEERTSIANDARGDLSRAFGREAQPLEDARHVLSKRLGRWITPSHERVQLGLGVL